MRYATLCLSIALVGCASVAPSAPAKIDPPPVALVTKCAEPGPFAGRSAQDLAEWTVGWIGAYGCERSKRAALVEAWPK